MPRNGGTNDPTQQNHRKRRAITTSLPPSRSGGRRTIAPPQSREIIGGPHPKPQGRNHLISYPEEIDRIEQAEANQQHTTMPATQGLAHLSHARGRRRRNPRRACTACPRETPLRPLLARSHTQTPCASARSPLSYVDCC